MPASVITSNDGQKDAAGTTITIPLTISGSNRVIYVGGSTGGNGVGVSSVTWGGTSDTIDELYDDASGPTFAHISKWRIKNPQVGTFNVVVTFAAAVPGVAAAIALADVDQSTPNDAPVTSNEENVSGNTLAVPTAADRLVVAFMIGLTPEAFTASNGQTTATDELNAGDNVRMVCGHKVATGASQSMEWTFPDSSNVRSIGVSVNTAVGGGGGGPESYAPSSPRFPRRMARLRG